MWQKQDVFLFLYVRIARLTIYIADVNNLKFNKFIEKSKEKEKNYEICYNF